MAVDFALAAAENLSGHIIADRDQSGICGAALRRCVLFQRANGHGSKRRSIQFAS